MAIGILALAALLLQAPAPPLEMHTYHVVVLRSVPGTTQPVGPELQKLSEAHLAGLADLGRQRVNVMHGPMLDEGPIRGIVVLDVPTAEEARARIAADPFVRLGLMAVEIKPWLAPAGWFHEPASYDTSDPHNLEPLIFGLLVAGPNRGQDEASGADIQKGHLAYIKGLAQQGKLVAAGPFLDDGTWRGVVIYRVGSVAEAEALAAGDPAVKAGRLKLEAHPWMTFRGILK
jgi:uncharacterized protein YciI